MEGKLLHKLVCTGASLSLLLCLQVPASAFATEGVPGGFTASGALDADAADYTVSTADQLAAVAAAVNAGDSLAGKTVELACDIDLSSIADWPVIGTGSAPFKGTFDGKGHALTGLSITDISGGYHGLFGRNDGVIKDFSIIGTIGSREAQIRTTADYVGGVCGYNNGTISNVDGTVGIYINTAGGPDTSQGYGDGGIVGQNAGVVTQCINRGDVTATKGVGGVCGRSWGVNARISQCVNTGTVRGLYQSKDAIGGITGSLGNKDKTEQPGKIDSCYNTGAVSDDNGRWIGGIAGFATVSTIISNCYNVGTIGQAYSNAGGLICYADTGAMPLSYKNYALIQSGYTGASYSGKTLQAAKMLDASFVTSLGSSWRADTYELNGGYPILTWQVPAAVSIATAQAIPISSYEFSGSAVEPALTVILGGKQLVAGRDYEVVYVNNVHAGTATALAVGMGDYYGTLAQSFFITRKGIAGASIALPKSMSCTGAALKPSTSVSLDGLSLEKDVDYLVSYAGNVKPGAAQVTIQGIGDYEGAVLAGFTIVKGAQKLSVKSAAKTVKVKKLKKKAVSVKPISKVTGAKGKLSYRKMSGSAKLKVNAGTGKLTVKKGTKKGRYKVKVKVCAAATSCYAAASKAVTLTVRVK